MRAARDVAGGIRYDLELVDGDERIPAIFLVPHAPGPQPAALLLHGFGSEKERMADSVGFALMTRGVCALAIDLPMHGARSEGAATLSMSNPMQIVGTWRAAVREARCALEFLQRHDAVDPARIGLVGYSLGSFLANIVAADTPSVQAVVLAASGDLPEGLPFESLVRAVVDPLRAVRRLGGRPLLMVNGRFDRTVKPGRAERLFAAAHEPKTMRWYGGGHWPPAREINYAAEWLASSLLESHTPRTRASMGE
ncbi:MAG TPA: alpha/beta fold hydrolase [Gemmatimonadaceae bacterium]|nr:alpha/beta fold hydrolase [Gemmatimonadaceae bacterium]